jgi:transmembrane sensor
MNPARDEHIREAIEQRATEWFVRHREGELSAAEQQDYLEWLRASPRHVDAYLQVIALSGKLPEAIAGLDLDGEALAQSVAGSRMQAEGALFSPTRQMHPSHANWRVLPIAAAAAVLVMVAGGLYWGAVNGRSSSTIAAPRDAQRMVRLDDGSVAHLDSDTRIRVRYSNAQRVIELTQGRALFNAAHDPRRPFIVRAGPTDVVAVGTSFDVYRQAGNTRVTVVEGRVEIVAQRPGAGSALPPVRLDAGEQVTVQDRSGSARPVTVDARSATAWARTEVSFNGARLEDVAAQFNRYTGANMAIEDPLLRDYRISGVFQAYDLDSFLAYLGHLEGVAVERHGDEIRVARRGQ